MTEMKKAETIIDEKLNSICDISDLSIAFSSNPYDYVEHRKKDFEDIVRTGNAGLSCMLTKFESSEENGLKEYVMAIACSEILKENPEDKNWSTGREWYGNFIKSNK